MRGFKTAVLGIALLLLTVTILGYLYYIEQQRQVALKQVTRPGLDLSPSALEAEGPGSLEVELYFCRPGAVNPDSDFLFSEKRSVFKTEDAVLMAVQITNEIIIGSEEKELKVFSENSRLRQIYLLEDGTAIVDLSREASRELVGGVTSELCALYSLVRSLVENVEEIKRVQFIVEGQPQTTFAGHVSIRRPFM